ncbi:MAG: saccharopine dehydrogenase NADP-binding domain-containing protein [Gemmatimonadaceae bacterium]
MRSEYVGVFGANGHTGRFVAAELARRGIQARWIGRDQNALRALQFDLQHGDVRVASVADAASLARAFDGLGAVINCAGPFFDTSRPVIAAALAAGSHYLDVTAEQATVLDTIEMWDRPAKAAERVVLPAMAFFGGLADLIATSTLGTWTTVDAIAVAVALDSWHPTPGTRLTGQRNTAARVIVRDGTLSAVPTPPPSGTWDFPAPFGSQPVKCVALSEIITLSRHIEANAITSYMTMRPLADLADTTTPPPKASDALGRSDQRFAMAVRVRRGAQVRESVFMGRDIYAVSAPLIVEASARLLRESETGHSGVSSPGEIFDATDFLASLGDVLERVQMPTARRGEFVHAGTAS